MPKRSRKEEKAMKMVRVSSVVLAGGALLLLGATVVEAQHRGGGHNSGGHNSGGHNSGGHNSGGHNSGRHHGGTIHGGGHFGGNIHGGNIHGGNIHGGIHHGGNIHGGIHHGSTYVVPHLGRHHHGSYYVRGGSFFYYPQTATAGHAHTTAYRPQPIQFGGFSHVDDLAGRLVTLTNELCLDLHYNYPHNPGFQHTYREAYQVLDVAKYIHAAEHRHDRAAIQERLAGTDQLFHHVQGEVRNWSRHHHRQVGQIDLLARLDLIEATMHHLMNDVGVKPAPPAGGGQAPPTAGGHSHGAPATGAPPTFQSPIPPAAP